MSEGVQTQLRAILEQFLGLDRDVLVLSMAMVAFGRSSQMTGRWIPEHCRSSGRAPERSGCTGISEASSGRSIRIPAGSLRPH